MLSLIRHVAAVLMVLFVSGVMFCAAAQPDAPSLTPGMTELIDAHRTVMDRMNTLSEGGRLRPLDDTQMRPLLTQGWKLAGEWAGVWLDLYPKPSAEDLDNLFVDFTPPHHDPDAARCDRLPAGPPHPAGFRKRPEAGRAFCPGGVETPQLPQCARIGGIGR